MVKVGGCGGCLCLSCYYFKGNASCPMPDKCRKNGCGNGIHHLLEECEHYETFTDMTIKYCMGCPISIDQKGIMFCPLVDPVGCDECMQQYLGRIEKEEAE